MYHFLDSDPARKERRLIRAVNRSVMENIGFALKKKRKKKYDLYLCGHTHGGQICLKECFPLISHQFEGKQFNHGKWNVGNMTG